MKKQSGQKGFTLIEFMVVLTIVGILIATAYPLISGTIRQYKARTAARELTINFKKAKLAAVKYYRDVYIDFFNVGGTNCSYQIFVNVDRDTTLPKSTYNPGAGDILLDNVTLDPNVQLISTTFSNSQAGFNSRGLPTQASNQNIVLGSSDSRTYTLSVTLTGNVRVQ